MRRLAVVFIGLSVCLWAKEPKQDVQATTTQRAELGPGGAVRIDGSLGELDIQGWDHAEVEITLTKSVWRSSHDEAARTLDSVRVKADRKGADLEITTLFPSRNPITRPLRGKTVVSLQYLIKVPHDARLVIHHDGGDVRLQGITGAIEATVGRGDIELRLPDTNSYSIDAKCRVGGVTSDFGGGHHGRLVVGERFDHDAESSGQRAYLRVGIGGIQILKAAGTI